MAACRLAIGDTLVSGCLRCVGRTIGSLGNTDSYVHGIAVGAGTALAGLAGAASAGILVWQLAAIRSDINRQAELLDKPVLVFSERLEPTLVTIGEKRRVRLVFTINNIGSGVATECRMAAVDALPIAGMAVVDGNVDGARRTILADCDAVTRYILDERLKYQEETSVERDNLRLGNIPYQFFWERDVSLRSESFNVYCAIFYSSQRGVRKMATAWFEVDVDSGGGISATPRHLSYVDEIVGCQQNGG